MQEGGGNEGGMVNIEEMSMAFDFQDQVMSVFLGKRDSCWYIARDVDWFQESH